MDGGERELPTVNRAGQVRGQNKRKRTASRRKTSSAKTGRSLSNWAAAELRAARYRAGHAMRLAGLAMLALLIFLVAALSMTGRLDDVQSQLMANVDHRLERGGYVVQAIDLTGADKVSALDIAEVLELELGDGLVRLDPVEAKARIETISWVEHAAVRRLWPNRLGVLIRERTPYASWQLNGYYRVVDRSGVEIRDADPPDYDSLPRIVGEGANVAVAEILPVLATHPELQARVTHAIRVGERRWTLRLQSGAEVLLPADNPAAAIAILADLHADRGVLDLDAQAFDMRGEDGMAIRAWPDRAEQARQRGA